MVVMSCGSDSNGGMSGLWWWLVLVVGSGIVVFILVVALSTLK